ncbi:unnamed protein product [Nippostrongylus brasiliensis]|uniref:RRM domain-containing protein n=1 Tax=Nippostrongylus brasiliensis TaxID=27835 RepID=A0A158R3D3_NIPBR|nr:unnamed protein product [Nippostrongylus brasiliensis]
MFVGKRREVQLYFHVLYTLLPVITTDALIADGHDPATYLFRVNEAASTKPMSPSASPAMETASGDAAKEETLQAPPSEDKDKDIASRSIWVRGLTSATKAADLKVLCTKYGKVVRAKIFTSKKQSTSACYGYVTMADSASADKAAAAMHKTQIKGRTISVEKVEMFELRERPSKTADRREPARKPAIRDRDSQRTISAPRRFPTRGLTSSYSLRGRISRPGDRAGYLSSIRRPDSMSQRDLLSLMRRKEEEHRRREAEIEKERALERERERIRFEREQLEKERLQLQLQAALQQQKMAAVGPARKRDTYAPSSRGVRRPDYHSARDTREEKITSSHHRSTSDTRRGSDSRSRHVETTDRFKRLQPEIVTVPNVIVVAMILTVPRADQRVLRHIRPERNTIVVTLLRGPSYGSSSAWEGSASLGHSSSASAWSGRGASGGNGGWGAFGSSTRGASTGGSMRYDYDKYQQRY